MNVTLKLWINNQFVDDDCTANHIEATDWKAPDGVKLDLDERTLSGEAEATYLAYRSLARLVAEGGWGTDEPEDDDGMGEPVLTACPVALLEEQEITGASAGVILARHASVECETWQAFATAAML